MTEDEVYARLQNIFRESLNQPELQITPKSTPDNVVGWDSTAMVSIIMSVEEEFDFELSPDEMRNTRSVGDLARAVASHAGR